jgi:hypothetical protein
VSNRGSLTIPALWHLQKGFLFFLNYFSEKEGFLNRAVV